MVVWVAMVTGYHLVLCKSNLVPLSRVHDTVHNIIRQHVRYDKGIMVINIRWMKTNQCREKISENSMAGNNYKITCPVRWILFMINRIQAGPQHNLFSFPHKKTGKIVPITYRDLMVNMRKWLGLVGVTNTKKYSSHSLRRGATTQAFDRNISENMIMKMGGWASQCYRSYIDVNMKACINTWKKFTQ